MMKKLNEKGSILIMAVSIVMLILVILGIVLTIATSNQKRSIDEHSRKQAYLTGLSVAETIAGQIADNNAKFIPTSKDSSVNITKVTLSEGSPYGVEVNVVIEYNNKEEILIKVTSTYDAIEQEVQLTMKKKDGTWYKKVYSKIGDEFDETE